MEKGEQNLTISQLAKVSELLGHQILSLSKTIDFEITGGRPLHGSVRTNYSKKRRGEHALRNTAQQKVKTILHGIPHIEEVFRYIEIMESLGVAVRWLDNDTLEIVPPKELSFDRMNLESARKTRSFTFVGGLIHWSKSIFISPLWRMQNGRAHNRRT